MSTIVLNITYNNVSKKLTVPRTKTVHQVTELACEKFSVANSSGQLIHNTKILDSSLALRLTGLGNNAKLKLSLGSGPAEFEINVKLSVSFPNNDTKSMIDKVSSSATLDQLLQQFATKNNVDLLHDASQLVVSNTTYKSDDYSKNQLGAIVGKVSSLVIRMSFVRSQGENDRRIQQQKEIVETQLRLQRERNQKLREQREREEEARNAMEIDKEQEKNAMEIDKEQKEKEGKDSQEERGIENTVLHENADSIKATAEVPEQTENPSEEKNTQMGSEVDDVETPRLYIPQETPSTAYDNPDEDYNMTVSQAKLYQKLIQDSSKRKRKTVNVPKKYNFRIKFPDRSLLQINFLHDVETIKFGQLVKKIDELLIDKYVGNYILKLGYPPFQKIKFSFDYNSQYLVKLPEFQSERSVLIWEYVGNDDSKNGPFVQTDKVPEVKTSNELPQVVLESHRGELPEEKEAAAQPTSKPAAHETAPKKKGLPKWFKP